MTVARILDKKGLKIFSVREDASLNTIIRELASNHIGVLVVVAGASRVVGTCTNGTPRM